MEESSEEERNGSGVGRLTIMKIQGDELIQRYKAVKIYKGTQADK